MRCLRNDSLMSPTPHLPDVGVTRIGSIVLNPFVVVWRYARPGRRAVEE